MHVCFKGIGIQVVLFKGNDDSALCFGKQMCKLVILLLGNKGEIIREQKNILHVVISA